MNAPVRANNANTELSALKNQLEAREATFKGVLPAHIPVERFMRVIMVACQNNPDLVMKVSRDSLFNAAMRAASDGLLPDGREGAIVEFKGRAQWMPMIAGLRKKVRNSGEIATWDAHVVFENDDFDYQLGDEPFIRHKPTMADRGKPIGAYSIAVLKSGEKSREVMSIKEIEKVRAVSRSGSGGPWGQWFEEMARKTVARRHAKVLPMSTDLDDLMRRDDELYAFDAAKENASRAAPAGGLAGKLSSLVTDITPTSDDATKEEPETVDAGLIAKLETAFAACQTLDKLDEVSAAMWNDFFEASNQATKDAGEKIYAAHNDRIASSAGTKESTNARADTPPVGERQEDAESSSPPKDSASSDPLALAHKRGAAARAEGLTKRAVPPEYREPGAEELVAAWVDGWEGRAL